MSVLPPYMTTTPIAWWNFENATDLLIDKMANYNGYNLIGTIDFQTAKEACQDDGCYLNLEESSGGVAYFNDACFQIPPVTPFNGANIKTCVEWVRPRDSMFHSFQISKDNLPYFNCQAYTVFGFRVYATNSIYNLGCSTWGNGDNIYETNIKPLDWHLCVMSYNGSGNVSNCSIWLDGAQVPGVYSHNSDWCANPPQLNTNTNYSAIGNEFWNATGQVASIRYYNTILSQAEITAIYEAEKPICCNEIAITKTGNGIISSNQCIETGLNSNGFVFIPDLGSYVKEINID